MEVSTETNNDVLTLRLAGEATIYGASELKARLDNVFSDHRDCVSLELDLSGVTEMDSAGLQLALAAKREAVSLGKGFKVVAHGNASKALATLYNLDDYLNAAGKDNG
ncbi:MAG: STAS domain-containing protein [Deltaproteobacteria bacterium]|nr:STAS domain-containing protein [Deltaproteobacteria bacterium]